MNKLFENENFHQFLYFFAIVQLDSDREIEYETN